MSENTDRFVNRNNTHQKTIYLKFIIGFIRTSKANNPDGYYVQSRIQTKD